MIVTSLSLAPLHKSAIIELYSDHSLGNVVENVRIAGILDRKNADSVEAAGGSSC